MIKQGQATTDELGSRLRSFGPIDVRLLIRRTAEGLLVVTGVVNAGDDLSGLEERTYDYGEVLFIKAVVDGDDLADWLTRKSGEVHGLTFSLPEPSPNCSWFHSESFTHARYGTRFTTPHTEYEVIPQGRIETPMPGAVLAGAGLPFFPDVNVASASVLFGEHSMPAGPDHPFRADAGQDRPRRSVPRDGRGVADRTGRPGAWRRCRRGAASGVLGGGRTRGACG
ncbi:MAG: hypothetical protein OXH41_11425 [Chloroflexi bacterium]|nr:hypothetical protein [Chloroflexota bacterium]